MIQEKYNGYTNYPTWCAALWFKNNYEEYKKIKELTKIAKDMYELTDLIESHIIAGMPDITPSFYQDILSWGLSKIDVYEIAKILKEDQT